MMRWAVRTQTAIWVEVIVALAISACDTTLDPFVESDLTFTILGYLDTDVDTQRVRIVPLRQVVDRGGPEPIDAHVKTTDLTSGKAQTWQDAITLLDDNTYAHVFWADFRAQPGHRYRIEVTRSDGATTVAETTVPRLPVEPDSVYGALNESGSFAPLFWPGVTRVIDLDVTYRVNVISCLNPAFRPPEEAETVSIRYAGDDLGEAWSANTWRSDLRLQDDREVIVDSLGADRSLDICVALYSLKVRLATPSDDWEPPGGIWDPEVLIQPGTFSNVEGGLGWFGSVARSTVDWQLSLIALRDLDYYQYVESAN